jgi:hypothetical protein
VSTNNIKSLALIAMHIQIGPGNRAILAIVVDCGGGGRDWRQVREFGGGVQDCVAVGGG